MRNFQLIRAGIDVSGIKSSLLSDGYASIWLKDTNRQRLSSALKDTLNIHMRRLPFVAENVNESNRILTIVDDTNIMQLDTMKIIRTICDSVFESEIARSYGRIMISRLKAGCSVGRHTDRGDYFDHYRGRYHLVIAANEGCGAEIDGETSIMREGEIWWVNNHVPHTFWNNGETDRINVIFDLGLQTPCT